MIPELPDDYNASQTFIDENLQRNPFLGSAYVRTLAADESLRLHAATQAANGIGKATDHGAVRQRRQSGEGGRIVPVDDHQPRAGKLTTREPF